MNKKDKGNLPTPSTYKTIFAPLDSKRDKLSKMVSSTVNEWYEAKHPKPSPELIGYINTLASECPNCGSKRFAKDGKRKNGIQRYKCSECAYRFSPLSGTIFDSAKIPLTEWIEFLIGIFRLQSIESTSLNNRNAYSTGRYWIKKVFAVLKGYQDDIELKGIIWIDETYVPKVPSETELTKEGKQYGGLSRNQHCIATATNGSRIVLLPCGFGKPSSRRLLDTLLPHLKSVSMIIDDGERAHAKLISCLKARRISFRADKIKGLPDKDNPLNKVNQVHRHFKHFLQNHPAINRSDLLDWCNLFAFIWNHDGDIALMVIHFFKMSSSKRELLRYRKTMSRKREYSDV